VKHHSPIREWCYHEVLDARLLAENLLLVGQYFLLIVQDPVELPLIRNDLVELLLVGPDPNLIFLNGRLIRKDLVEFILVLLDPLLIFQNPPLICQNVYVAHAFFDGD
jgi:hypothetical protein